MTNREEFQLISKVKRKSHKTVK